MKKTKIILIRPPGYFVSTVFPDGPMVCPPKGIMFLAGLYKNDPNVEVKIIDALAYPDLEQVYRDRKNPPFYFGMSFENIIQEVKTFEPDIIGVSGLANYFQDVTIDLSRRLRKTFPDTFLCLGGPDPTADYSTYLKAIRGLDAIILREGEITFKNLVSAIQSGSEWRNIKGLAFKKDNRIVQTDVEEKIPHESMDNYAPDFDQIDFDHYFEMNRLGFQSRISYHHPQVDKAIDIITSRGCPFKCTFCSIHLNFGRPFRANSVEHVINQMDLLIHQYGVRHFHFEDDHITFDLDRFKSILREIIKRKWDIVWDCPNGMRADTVDRELAQLAAQSGCAYLVFGVESGSQRILDDVVNKSLKLEQVENAAKYCQEAQIDTLAFFIIGFPGETKEEVLETYNFGMNLYKNFNCAPILQFWRPFKKTDLEVETNKNDQLMDIDAQDIYNKYKIPYTLFREKMLGPDQYNVDFLAKIFQKYMKESTRMAFFTWLRIVSRHPHVLFKTMLTIFIMSFKILTNVREGTQTLRKYIYSRALYPYAQIRKINFNN